MEVNNRHKSLPSCASYSFCSFVLVIYYVSIFPIKSKPHREALIAHGDVVMLKAELQNLVFWAYSRSQVQWGPNLSQYCFFC